MRRRHDFPVFFTHEINFLASAFASLKSANTVDFVQQPPDDPAFPAVQAEVAEVAEVAAVPRFIGGVIRRKIRFLGKASDDGN